MPGPESLIGKKSDDPAVRQFLLDIGETPSIDSFAGLEIFDYREKGISIYLDEDGRVATIFLYRSGHEEHGQYGGALPDDLSFEWSRAEVARRLGAPSAHGTEEESGSPWERFDFDSYSIHFK